MTGTTSWMSSSPVSTNDDAEAAVLDSTFCLLICGVEEDWDDCGRNGLLDLDACDLAPPF